MFHEKNAMKAQNNMKHIMTYGLVVFVVILFILFFESSDMQPTPLPTVCIPQPDFLCGSLQMNTTGNVIVRFGESLGVPINITSIGCSSTSAESNFVTDLITVQPDLETTLTFQCPITSNAIGTTFTGTLWINYTKNGVVGSQISQIGTLTAKAITSNSLKITTSSNI